MTPREISALSDIRFESKLRPWAIERADFANVHFREKGTAAYMEDDFLSGSGGKDRVQRGLEQAKQTIRTMRANQNLLKIRPGAAPTPDVPAWAIGGYHAN